MRCNFDLSCWCCLSYSVLIVFSTVCKSLSLFIFVYLSLYLFTVRLFIGIFRGYFLKRSKLNQQWLTLYVILG